MMSNQKKNPWVLVLAAGDGTRVRSLTLDRWGEPAPKQFTRNGGEHTLLGLTLRRARRIAPAEQIVTIVAAQHERWWESELCGLPADNIIVQPENRGTAAGILLPLTWITHQDPNATVVILPSDHFVESEETMNTALEQALSAVTGSEVPIVLMGVRPDAPEEEYGWILPCPGPENCPHRVASFREKPDVCSVASLLQQGALLNTFIIVADSRCLMALFKDRTPQLWGPFNETLSGWTLGSLPQGNLADLYHSIPSLDFSKEVLEGAAEKLWVYPVPSCGWTDLGTPQRLKDHLVQHGEHFPPSGTAVEATSAPG
jgi:mannose-1-phosphate guanylyltransferase